MKLRFDYIFKQNPHPGAPQVNLVEIDSKPFIINDLHITPINIHHGQLPIWGYRINDMAYITDASAIPEVEFEKLENLEVLIINALRKKKHYSHFNLEEALEATERIKAKRTYITHVSHLMGLNADWEATLPESVSSLKDRMVIDV